MHLARSMMKIAPATVVLSGTLLPSSGYKPVDTGALLIANYYLEAAMALPIVSLGYRFK